MAVDRHASRQASSQAGGHSKGGGGGGRGRQATDKLVYNTHNIDCQT